VPSDAHLTGLASCTIAWLTTEDLLAQLVGGDAAPVWRWLAGLPFITASPRGLSAHDLTRDVLDAEFERRAPQRYGATHAGLSPLLASVTAVRTSYTLGRRVPPTSTVQSRSVSCSRALAR
jgi:hypothetical protein